MTVALGAASLGALLAGVALGVLLTRRRRPVPTPATGQRGRHDELLPQVVSALGTGVVVVDRDESVVLVNPAARSMNLVTTGRLTSEQLVRVARRVTDSGRAAQSSVDMPRGRLGRDPVAVSIHAIPLPDASGRVGAVVLLLDDVTEQRRLDSVRRDFVANVSHELKTPVGALSLLAEAVQEAADDPEAVQRFAARMQHEAARLGRLVRELIELSRLQGAEPLPGASSVRLDTVVAEAVDRTRLVAEQAGITVAARADPDLVVQGNETQLVTALVNLLDNAIAYSHDRSRVAVSARTAQDDAGWAELSVSDQGIGIAAADLDRVFERFYRVDPARSRATGGTGLGLSIVKHVATNHGGAVTVWSVEGAGSTFTIRLPRVHPDAGSSGSDDLAQRDMGQPTVREPA